MVVYLLRPRSVTGLGSADGRNHEHGFLYQNHLHPTALSDPVSSIRTESDQNNQSSDLKHESCSFKTPVSLGFKPLGLVSEHNKKNYINTTEGE